MVFTYIRQLVADRVIRPIAARCRQTVRRLGCHLLPQQPVDPVDRSRSDGVGKKIAACMVWRMAKPKPEKIRNTMSFGHSKDGFSDGKSYTLFIGHPTTSRTSDSEGKIRQIARSTGKLRSNFSDIQSVVLLPTRMFFWHCIGYRLSSTLSCQLHVCQGV